MNNPALPDRAPFEALYQAHLGWLQGWLRQRTGCRQDAADLAQDTFLRLLSKERDLAPVREPRAYLTKVAHGLLVNQWRRRAIERAYLEALAALPPAATPSPEARELVIATLQEIDTLLRALPYRVRTAFLLAQLDGLGYREIAERLQVSERMVKKYMAQAMLHCLSLAQD
ncbi:sigma-70 family RNA polymerase sigma factor [Pseudomonas sp. DC3200b2]|uniref:sigma-70 family RNA polymerase sigma factor n=1 Tax=Pseudomonas sp. DC3200b2 TaxID=2804669 RepID=UPI003CF67F6B